MVCVLLAYESHTTMGTPREYFFKPGNKFGKGRPPGQAKVMETIRGRLLRVLKRRIFHEKDLETVKTADLLKFFVAIMPKDHTLTVRPQGLNYVSNIPRSEELAEQLPTLITEQEEHAGDNGKDGQQTDPGLLRGELPAPGRMGLDGQEQLQDKP